MADFTFLKGNIETIILCSLYNNDKYGYEIAKDIKARSESKYVIKQPTLYSYLKRLEEDGLILSYWGAESNGGRRRYYKLTENGRADCQQFMSEWNYQKSVMETLVDSTTAADDIENNVFTQEDATSILGRKNPSRKKRESKTNLEDQDEIARRLAALESASQVAEEVQPQQSEPTAPEQPAQDDVTAATTAAPQQPSEAEIAAAKAKFDVNQDNAEDFMQGFEELAQGYAGRQTHESSGENYQHVLLGVLGDQLDDMNRYADVEQSIPPVADTEHPAALEDVADALAKNGIRMRIYNHAAAAYKPKTLMPNAKVHCVSAWWTYLVAVTFFGILSLASVSSSNWQPFIITIAVLLIAPLAVSIYAIANPGRREKPNFSFKIAIIITATIAAIIILIFVSINVFGNIELGNFKTVSTRILIPVGIAILIPAYVLIYNYYYTRY